MNFLKTISFVLLSSIIAMTFTACDTSSSGDSIETKAIDKIVRYAETNGSSTAPTVQDYKDAGVTGVDAENLSVANAEIEQLSGEDVDRSHKIQWSLCGTCQIGEDPDTIKPVIHLNGNSTVQLTVGDVYVDAGATADDNRDGNLGTITPSGSVDTSRAGVYTLTYEVSDKAGNTTTVTRTVVVAPAATPTPLTTSATPAPTPTPSIGEEISFTPKPQGTCTPDVNDTRKPTIQLLGLKTRDGVLGTIFTDLGAKANDLDNNGKLTYTGKASVTRTSKLEINNEAAVSSDPNKQVEYNLNVLGKFTIKYSYVDKACNKAAISPERTITVIAEDTEKPVISIPIGSEKLTYTTGNTYILDRVTAMDNVDGDITHLIELKLKVGDDYVEYSGGQNTFVAQDVGTFIIQYSVTDAAGNEAEKKYRTIEVTD